MNTSTRSAKIVVVRGLDGSSLRISRMVIMTLGLMTVAFPPFGNENSWMSGSFEERGLILMVRSKTGDVCSCITVPFASLGWRGTAGPS